MRAAGLAPFAESGIGAVPGSDGGCDGGLMAAKMANGEAGGAARLAARAPRLEVLFYCIGAQKAGTTWLAKTLAGHPECHVPRLKELSYWNRVQGAGLPGEVARRRAWRARQAAALARAAPSFDRTRISQAYWAFRLSHHGVQTARDPSLRRYVDLLTRQADGARVIGEASPAYALLDPEAYARMAALHPSARFVFVMRDPVDRIWSALGHRMRDKPLPAAERARRRHRQFARKTVPGNRLFAMSDYAATIAALEAAVPPERICYLFFETMRTRTEMARLSDFLGLDAIPFDPDFRTNEASGAASGPDPEARDAVRARLRHVYDAVEARFGDAVPLSWRSPVPA